MLTVHCMGNPPRRRAFAETTLTRHESSDVLRLGTPPGNGLLNLPDAIGHLLALESLNARFNQMTSLLPVLFHLTKLTTLDVGNNRLTSLPADIGQLTQLKVLKINHNQLTDLPESLGKLSVVRRPARRHVGSVASRLTRPQHARGRGRGRVVSSPPSRSTTISSPPFRRCWRSSSRWSGSICKSAASPNWRCVRHRPRDRQSCLGFADALKTGRCVCDADIAGHVG